MGLNLQTGSIMAVKQVQIGSSHAHAQQDVGDLNKIPS